MTFKTKLGGLKRAASVLALAGSLAACATPHAGGDGLYAAPIGNAPVTANPTPYSQALVCIGENARARSVIGPRIAVGRILDYTGKVDAEGGRRLTQGASLMAITAFAKAGARLVERFDTSVSELELRYANNRLIADQPQTPRPITAGQVPGSDFYLVGGITELNYNIRSIGAEASIGQVGARDTKGALTGKLFVMNIGLDLRLVSTQTLEVVDVVSYQKQIVGREVRAGVFTFWDSTLFDVGAGERALEPMQMAVRAGVERGVVEMMSNLYGQQSSAACAEALRAGGDPMGSATVSGNFRNHVGVDAAQAGARRVDPGAWHENRDPAISGRVSGAPAADAERRPSARPANSPAVASRTAEPPTQVAQAPARRTLTGGPAVLVTRAQPTSTSQSAGVR